MEQGPRLPVELVHRIASMSDQDTIAKLMRLSKPMQHLLSGLLYTDLTCRPPNEPGSSPRRFQSFLLGLGAFCKTQKSLEESHWPLSHNMTMDVSDWENLAPGMDEGVSNPLITSWILSLNRLAVSASTNPDYDNPHLHHIMDTFVPLVSLRELRLDGYCLSEPLVPCPSTAPDNAGALFAIPSTLTSLHLLNLDVTKDGQLWSTDAAPPTHLRELNLSTRGGCLSSSTIEQISVLRHLTHLSINGAEWYSELEIERLLYLPELLCLNISTLEADSTSDMCHLNEIKHLLRGSHPTLKRLSVEIAVMDDDDSTVSALLDCMFTLEEARGRWPKLEEMNILLFDGMDGDYIHCWTGK